MIHDLSLTLKKILEDPDLPERLKFAQIAFDHPSDSFKPGQTTIDLFLGNTNRVGVEWRFLRLKRLLPSVRELAARYSQEGIRLGASLARTRLVAVRPGSHPMTTQIGSE